MIIVDLNQVMISNLMAQIGNHTNIELDEGLLRHMILNSIRLNKLKFKDYGEMIIACDDKNYWRKDLFPYYKAARKTQRQKSELDWNAIFDILNRVRDELKEYFPYRVIQVNKAEADDIIASLVNNFGSILDNGDKQSRILILSGDKDFVQLQKWSNVDQYNPVLKKFVKHSDPQKYVLEHTIKGDRSDGVPNIASDDSCFVNGGRQKPIRKTKVDEIIRTGEIPEEWKRGWSRNEQLVNLEFIPDYICDEVLRQYNDQHNKRDSSKLFNYFIKHKLKNLTEHIGDFK
jgi:hypothetical protein